MEFIFITNNPEMAAYAQKIGVERIMVDLEYIGKKKRQGHLDTLISNHSINDIKKVKKIINHSKLLVRVNPIYERSKEEIDKAISNGAEIIMLPMFKTVSEVEKFISIINGRVKNILLLETSQALVRINEILKIKGINETYIGLNDLHLSMGLNFMFELLSGGIIEYLANIFKKHQMKWGFGGIAKIGQGDLPAEYILAEHVRLNSQMVILSRTLHEKSQTIQELKRTNFMKEIQKLRRKEKEIKNWPAEKFIKNKSIMEEKVKRIVKKLQ
ncbi:MAG: aldolase/citrate lyase family protein [Patescibacteria group bacterium]|nr:aldolase/citrate lyase family protein [Patescibacteria group bacterium]